MAFQQMHSRFIGSVDDQEKCGFVAPLEARKHNNNNSSSQSFKFPLSFQVLGFMYSTMLPSDAEALEEGLENMMAACSASGGTRYY